MISFFSIFPRRIFFEISKTKSTAKEIAYYELIHDLCLDFLYSLSTDHLFFYFHQIDEDPDRNAKICLDRIHRRNRAGEENITLEYLQLVETANRAFSADFEDKCISFEKFCDLTEIKAVE